MIGLAAASKDNSSPSAINIHLFYNFHSSSSPFDIHHLHSGRNNVCALNPPTDNGLLPRYIHTAEYTLIWVRVHNSDTIPKYLSLEVFNGVSQILIPKWEHYILLSPLSRLVHIDCKSRYDY